MSKSLIISLSLLVGLPTLYFFIKMTFDAITGDLNKNVLTILKISSVALLLYSSISGFISTVPRLPILNETIRNLYFHVPMWFGMTFLLLLSLIGSIAYIRNGNVIYDRLAVSTANVGLLFGVLGILTGMVWAKVTWGTFWTRDPKLNSAAAGMFIYLGYFVLRGAFQDEQQRMRISSIFNIIAFFSFMALIYIYPRLTDSLHPGNGGNPGFNAYDRDRQMNIIFYSACTGFILLGVWISNLKVRLKKIEDKIHDVSSYPSESLDARI